MTVHCVRVVMAPDVTFSTVESTVNTYLNNHTRALQVQDRDLTSPRYFMGCRDTNLNTGCQLSMGSSVSSAGELWMRLQANGSDLRVYTGGTRWDDGTQVRGLIKFTGSTMSDIEIYKNGSGVSTTVENSGTYTGMIDFVDQFPLFARRDGTGSSVDAFSNVILDDVVFYNTASVDPTYDYNRQPWS